MSKSEKDPLPEPLPEPKPLPKQQAPEPAPSPASGPTQVVVTGEPVGQPGGSAEVRDPENTNYEPPQAYLDALQKGYIGVSPGPQDNLLSKAPAHGSGDLRFAPNAPQASNPGLETPGARADLDEGIAPEGVADENFVQEPPELTPDQWANGPEQGKAEGDKDTLTPKVLEPPPPEPERGSKS